ncbi:hypothetical protein AcW1_009602 [Taiwanofungus camphoratus]|nr:hypothetical protein AcV7_002606 [Antrodia cinnamomea]KAI0947977.1 hypothetical protein AcW1_009602 [Antrodia cinnamomea]
MNLDSGAQNQHQKDFIHSLFPPESNRDAELFHSHSSGQQSSMNFQSALANHMPVSMDVLESLMNTQDGSGQHGLSTQSQATPQMLLEQQLRLNQLQQLQQLQNQIFQQQIELLSGQGSLMSMPPPNDRQRDQSQYGLPTPASSTELRAQQSPDFVSPMILHSNNVAMGNMQQSNQPLPEYLPQHMIPPTPHSAPANLVFQTSPPLPLPSPAELEFGDISPLTSPWLGAYNTAQGAASNVRNSQPVPPVGNKRRSASSSDDESAAATKPSRKRQLPAVRTSSRAPAAPKRASLRGTRSANSTPLFPATARPGAFGGGPNPGDIPGDTPSPIELPPMPPPAQFPPSAPTSMQGPSVPSGSASPTPASAVTSPMSVSAPPAHMTPVTPASIMNLGRLGINSTLAPPRAVQDSSGAKRKDASSKGKSPTRTNPTTEPSKAPRANKASNVPIISPSLKPIRPAGNTPVMGTPSPSTAFSQPVVQIRKSSHKAAEQKRRDSLKTSFDDLRILLPPIPLPSDEGYPDEPVLPGAMPPRGPPKGNAEGPNRGVSKLQLLRCGNEFIKILKGRVERRDEEIDTLRREIVRLRLLVGEDAAEAGEVLDLNRDLDAGEATAEGDDADEEGGE